MIVFETSNLIIRGVEDGDFNSLLSIYNKAINMLYISNSRYNWTIDELKEKYKAINNDIGYGLFVIELKKKSCIVGEAGLFNSFQDCNVLELGYIIDSQYWNNNYGTETCEGLIEYSFKCLNIDKVIARMYSKNNFSVRICQKNNLRKVATNLTASGDEYFTFELQNSLKNRNSDSVQ